MSVSISPPIFLQFFNPNNSGSPASGYLLFTYEAGTTTKQATWTDSTQTVENANPLSLDSNGCAVVWGDPTLSYKFVLASPTDTDPPSSPLRTTDNIQYPMTESVFVSLLGPTLYPQTTAEIAADVTPTNYIYPPGDVRRYGADATGSADSYNAFRSAFSVGGAVSAVGAFKIGTGLTLDISTTSLLGPAQISSAVASGALITVDATSGAEANGRNTISGIEFIGQGITGVQAIVFATSSADVDNFSIENGTITNFADGVWIQELAFEVQFRGVNFSNCGSDHAAVYITYSSSERIALTQCALYNNVCAIVQSSGGEIYLDNCSLDYNTQTHVKCTSGTVFLTGCYLESSFDNNYWFITEANASLISLLHCHIVQTGPKPTYSWGNSASTYSGGILMRHCTLDVEGGTNSVTPQLVTGNGYAFGWGNTIRGFAQSAQAWGNFSLAAQLCSNGTFANGSGGLGGWTVGSHTGSGGNPTVSANTLQLQVTTGGQDQFAYWTLNNVLPGDNIGITCNAKVNNTSQGFGIIIRAYGGDGVQISTSTQVVGLSSFGSANPLSTTAYTVCRAVFPSLPPGTTSVQVEVNTNGASSASYVADVQNVVITKV